MEKSRRQANFELLRIIAMFMVVILHWNTHSRLLPDAGSKLGSAQITALLTESLCIVAVNVYVLISGYFLSSASFSFRRVLRVLIQTLFYTVLIPPVLALFGVLSWGEVFNPYHIWNSIFPVQSGHYWFVSAYVILCLLSPFLNAGMEKLSKKQFEQVLGVLLLFFCIGKTLSIFQFATDRYGYDFGWFTVMYLTGGYLRKYGLPRFTGIRRGLLLYAGSALVIFASELVLLPLSGRIPALVYYASVPFHYNDLFCYLGAVGLFCAFWKLQIPEGRFTALIRFLSPAVFGVYLIHEQMDISQRWFAWVNGLTGRLGSFWQIAPGDVGIPAGQALVVALLQAVIVFVVCIGIEKLRLSLFHGIEKRYVRSAGGR